MRTSKDVDQGLSTQLAKEIQLPDNLCYAKALYAALTMHHDYGFPANDLFYCEGWAVSEAAYPAKDGQSTMAEDQKHFVMVAHGWAERGQKVVDITGVAAAYFASTRLRLADMKPETTEIPCFAYSERSHKRHKQQMQAALTHVLRQAPSWTAFEMLTTGSK